MLDKLPIHVLLNGYKLLIGANCSNLSLLTSRRVPKSHFTCVSYQEVSRAKRRTEPGSAWVIMFVGV
jgi:hypothetical protein